MIAFLAKLWLRLIPPAATARDCQVPASAWPLPTPPIDPVIPTPKDDKFTMRNPLIRPLAARQIRTEAAEIAFLRTRLTPVNNGEEAAYRNNESGTFSLTKFDGTTIMI